MSRNMDKSILKMTDLSQADKAKFLLALEVKQYPINQGDNGMFDKDEDAASDVKDDDLDTVMTLDALPGPNLVILSKIDPEGFYELRTGQVVQGHIRNIVHVFLLPPKFR